jgi:CDP-6-deoxy-D-xylo-4-hexulose-3-dehydrase
MVLRPDAPVGVDAVKRQLEAHGVETRPIIAGNLARHPASEQFRIRQAGSLEQCDALLARGFMIGCHPVIAPGAIDTLSDAIASLAQL